jgi:hypothetical protein
MVEGPDRHRGLEAAARPVFLECLGDERRTGRAVRVEAGHPKSATLKQPGQLALAASDVDHAGGRGRQPTLNEGEKVWGEMRDRFPMVTPRQPP